jgi:hypothetical protein
MRADGLVTGVILGAFDDIGLSQELKEAVRSAIGRRLRLVAAEERRREQVLEAVSHEPRWQEGVPARRGAAPYGWLAIMLRRCHLCATVTWRNCSIVDFAARLEGRLIRSRNGPGRAVRGGCPRSNLLRPRSYLRRLPGGQTRSRQSHGRVCV